MQTALIEKEQQAIMLNSEAPAGSKQRLKHKAGIALLREAQSSLEVLLVQQANGRWSLPKGKRKEGETIKETCLRECLEETGYEPQVLNFVGWGINSRKHVRFYLWKSRTHRMGSQGRPELRRHEILRKAWVALSQAKQMLKPWQANLLAKVSS
ncbi:MAG TPA: NUDIX hydrolase [Terriglobia bacterium]|nr:NUDIX hydrolase [Terriglobia bacterium]